MSEGARHTKGREVFLSNEAIDAMDLFAVELGEGKIGGRNDYMAAFERIVDAGAYVTPSHHDEIVGALRDIENFKPDEDSSTEPYTQVAMFAKMQARKALALAEQSGEKND